jgi:hypothetical protein
MLVSVVGCLASQVALDGLVVASCVTFRVAPDELLLLSGPDEVEAVVALASAQLGEEALVLDQSDAFAGWMLCGDDVDEAFCRLSAIAPPNVKPSMHQGLVAHLPAKFVTTSGALHLLVPSTLSHHLRQRIRDACADLEIYEMEASLFEVGAVVVSAA